MSDVCFGGAHAADLEAVLWSWGLGWLSPQERKITVDAIAWWSVTVSVFGQAISVVEILGFGTAAVGVWASSRQYVWSWPVTLVSCLSYFMVFLQYGLYANAALQWVFAGAAIYGWWLWARGIAGVSLRVRRVIRREIGVAVVATVLCVAVVAMVLRAAQGAAPWADGLIFAGSLVATWGQARKILEHWWVWLVVDVVAVPLYAAQGLWLTAVLYIGFIGLCVLGWRQWRSTLTVVA